MTSGKLFLGPCDFVRGVAQYEQLPGAELPEIAFAGRSNVGKSSLINALTGRNSLAKTSNTPGRTQQLNFFDLGGKLMMVDLPGYGYAKAGKSAITSWNALIRAYLKGRPNLRRVCVLIDARHGVKKNDEEILKLLDESAVPYKIVLTKADKPKKGELDHVLAQCKAVTVNHPAAFPEILLTSSKKLAGIDELREDLASLAV